jgi:hypothetical protein
MRIAIRGHRDIHRPLSRRVNKSPLKIITGIKRMISKKAMMIKFKKRNRILNFKKISYGEGCFSMSNFETAP